MCAILGGGVGGVDFFNQRFLYMMRFNYRGIQHHIKVSLGKDK